MSKHLTKGCPLPIELIAKQRTTFTNQAREFFSFIEGFDHVDKRNLVAERTILFMDKYRNQTRLDDHLKGENEE